MTSPCVITDARRPSPDAYSRNDEGEQQRPAEKVFMHGVSSDWLVVFQHASTPEPSKQGEAIDAEYVDGWRAGSTPEPKAPECIDARRYELTKVTGESRLQRQRLRLVRGMPFGHR